jgi:hypothetical protein
MWKTSSVPDRENKMIVRMVEVDTRTVGSKYVRDWRKNRGQ